MISSHRRAMEEAKEWMPDNHYHDDGRHHRTERLIRAYLAALAADGNPHAAALLKESAP